MHLDPPHQRQDIQTSLDPALLVTEGLPPTAERLTDLIKIRMLTLDALAIGLLGHQTQAELLAHHRGKEASHRMRLPTGRLRDVQETEKWGKVIRAASIKAE